MAAHGWRPERKRETETERQPLRTLKVSRVRDDGSVRFETLQLVRHPRSRLSLSLSL